MVTISSYNYPLLLPVGSLIVLTQPTRPNAHTRGGVAAGSDKLHSSDKIMTLTAINSANDVYQQLQLFVLTTNFNFLG
jgi:hypothetical protein